jgi:hypothetical protein
MPVGSALFIFHHVRIAQVVEMIGNQRLMLLECVCLAWFSQRTWQAW